jgi:hypothetical protein
MAGVVLLMAACSSAGSSSPAAGSSPTAAQTTTTNQKLLAFSQCMRSHGVTNFPDPGSGGLDVGQGVNLSTAQAQAAVTTCRSILPGGNVLSPTQMAQALSTLLKYSECVRAHGVPQFPDPAIIDGKIGFNTTASAAARKSPKVTAAEAACQPVLTGH